MKLSLRFIALSVAVATLCIPSADARGRNNADHTPQRTEKRNAPPSHHGNHNGNSHRDHGNAAPKPDNFGHNNHNNNSKPDNRPPANAGWQNGNRPHGNHPGEMNRPNGNHSQPQLPPQPNFGQRPPQGHQNSYRPQTPPPPMQKPHRPNMPAHRPWQPPTPPPPTYRPAPGWTPFNTILGVALGSAINLGINALINNGYNVTGYGNDAVYIANATMLNMLWPDATLFYNNGGLYASEFVYSTPVYNMSRYNTTYRALVRNYGNPLRSTNNGGSITTTWWGPNGQFINLTFQNAIDGNGAPRFFTTLSFGN